MAETPEGRVKRKIKEMLQKHGAHVYYFMPAMGQYGKAGVPDIVACVKGHFLAIEVKADMHKNKPTLLQRKNMREILSADGVALVVDSSTLDLFEAFLNTLLGGQSEQRSISSGIAKVLIPRPRTSHANSTRSKHTRKDNA